MYRSVQMKFRVFAEANIGHVMIRTGEPSFLALIRATESCRNMVADLIRRLYVDRVWAKGHGQQEDVDALHRVLDNLDLDSTVNAILSSDTIGKASVLDVIEYGREVHTWSTGGADRCRQAWSVGTGMRALLHHFSVS